MATRQPSKADQATQAHQREVALNLAVTTFAATPYASGDIEATQAGVVVLSMAMDFASFIEDGTLVLPSASADTDSGDATS